MLIEHNYYLIVDLEATCDEGNRLPRSRRETIEIGAVMLNRRSLHIEDEFQTYIRPRLHPILTPFCQQLTSIRQIDVTHAPDFAEAFTRFLRWCNWFDSYLFCSWGEFDRRLLKQDCRRHELPYPFREYLDLKEVFSQTVGERRRYGVKSALRRLDLRLEGIPHRGLDDARNVARIVQAVLKQIQ